MVIDSGIAMQIPASQILPQCALRIAIAAALSMRREETSAKYSRPSRYPFTAQKTSGAKGPAIRYKISAGVLMAMTKPRKFMPDFSPS